MLYSRIIHMQLYIIHMQLYMIHMQLYIIHMQLYIIHMQLDIIHMQLYIIHMQLDIIHMQLYIIHMQLYIIHILSSPSYIIVQSPTQSLEWHIWSSSSGNNCHAVHRTISSVASVYDCTMGFYLIRFCQPSPPTWFLPITAIGMCHFRCPWNGMFDCHPAEITVMQFTGHSLPVHQFMIVPLDFNPVPYCQPDSPTPMEYAFPQSLEWRVLPGRWSIYNTKCIFVSRVNIYLWNISILLGKKNWVKL